jgi:FkbM family methyltransferase
VHPIRFLQRPEVRRDVVRVTSRRVLLELQRRWNHGDVQRERLVSVREAGRMLLRPANVIEGPIYVYGFFEFPVALAFIKLVARDNVVVDAGSNIGQYTLLAARRVGKSGRVLSFEPNPSIRGRLVRNVELNEYTNIDVLPFALGKHSGDATLYTPEGEPAGDEGWASLAPFQEQRPVQKVTVEVRTLDAVLEERGVRRVDVIKVDVEGTEADVLEGAANCLRRDRPAVFFEVHSVEAKNGGVTAAPIEVLRDAGYRILEPVVDGPNLCHLVEVPEGTVPGYDSETWRPLNLLAIHSQNEVELA